MNDTKTYKFTIPGRLPGYNDLNGKSYLSNYNVKQYAMEAVSTYARQACIRPFTSPVSIRVYCYEKDKRRDPDNIVSGAYKCVYDALKNMGIIKGDGWKYIVPEPHPEPSIDTKNPRVEVVISETEG